MKFAAVFLLALGAASAATVARDSSFRADMSTVKFILYTRSNKRGVEIEYDDTVGTDFSASRKTFVLMHGFNSNIGFAENFVDDLLAKEDSNVIGVDWSVLAGGLNYFQSAADSLEVGTHIGDFIVGLMEETGLQHRNVHGIGHSLGGQGMGHVGRRVTQRTGSKVDRLSILDPAKPYFDINDPSLIVSKNDADFVDVIHTNSGPLTDGCLSFIDPLGHIDFYPNGGVHQPGCTEYNCSPQCNDNDIVDLIKGGCSHSRAHQYFVESINANTAFRSNQCNSFEAFESGSCNGNTERDMGYPTTSGSGTFYLGVGDESPYALG